MIEMDPSVGQDPADEIKRLTQLARSRGGGVRSTSTRPTYSRQQPDRTPRDPQDVGGVYPLHARRGGNPDAPFHAATPMSESDAKQRGLTDQRGLNDPSSIYYIRPEQQPRGRDMAQAYQSLLHSVAMQHGGQPQADGPQRAGAGRDLKGAYEDLLHSVATQHGGQRPSGASAEAPGRAGPPGIPPTGGPASRDNQVGSQWAPGTPRNLFTGVVPKDPKEADALWGEREAAVKREDAQRSPSQSKEDKAGLSPPPKFPHGGNKEQITQYKEQHQEWEDERQYALAHASLEARGGALKTKAELAAVKSEYSVVKDELDSAKSKLESSGGMFSKQDPKLKKEVDKAQFLFDKVKAKRDKIINSTLDKDDEEGDKLDTKSSSMSDEEKYNALGPGETFTDSEGNVWKKPE